MWHDHATIPSSWSLSISWYDPVVFYTDEEYQQLNPGADVNIQAEVEQPEIHLLALGSSSVEDQAALIGDRLSCILELSEPVKTETGIEIKDTLRFFTLQLNLNKGQSRVVCTNVLCVAAKNTCLMTRHILCNPSGVLCNSCKLWLQVVDLGDNLGFFDHLI